MEHSDELSFLAKEELVISELNYGLVPALQLEYNYFVSTGVLLKVLTLFCSFYHCVDFQQQRIISQMLRRWLAKTNDVGLVLK